MAEEIPAKAKEEATDTKMKDDEEDAEDEDDEDEET